jgi:predicted nucleotidyltransferase
MKFEPSSRTLGGLDAYPAERRIAEVLRRFEGVRAVYLFGSKARGRARPDSDWDLAVVPRDAAVTGQRLAMLTALAQAGFDAVDLVFLDGRDVVLGFQAVRHNRLLYGAPDFDHPGYFSRVLREYFDLVPLLRVRHRAYRKRVGGG